MKKIIISSLLLITSSVFAQTKTNETQLKNSNVANINSSTTPDTKKNTPAATGGASYGGEVVSGLDEYNQRKKALSEKAEYIKSENQKKIEAEYRKSAYLSALKAAQAREKERLSKIPQQPTNNSNQEYFDRQTNILSGGQ
jgi:hypothetical protein